MADETKTFKQITDTIIPAIGGKDNAIEAFHCATRLRINLKDTSKVDKETLMNMPLVKGVNINPTNKQLQIIFGPGLVDRVTDFLINHTGILVAVDSVLLYTFRSPRDSCAAHIPASSWKITQDS